MQCAICGDDGYFYSPYLKQWLCKKHFEKMLIRRIRRNLLNNGIRAKKYKILKSTDGYLLLSRLFKEGESNIELDSYILENFAIEVLKYLMFNKEPSIKVKGNNYFNPLYNVSLDEIKAFYNLHGITGYKFEFDEDLLGFLNKLEEKRPGSKISIVESGIILQII